MNTTPEMTDAEKDLVEKLEVAGFPETARFVRNLIASTPNRDANADCENPGPDLFAGNASSPLFSEHWRKGTLKTITPEQARYAYDSALEASTQAVTCDLSALFIPEPVFFSRTWSLRKVETDGSVSEYYHENPKHYGIDPNEKGWTGWLVDEDGLHRKTAAKHTFIHLSGATRTENACL